jgi:hypothetical protein
LSGFKKTHRLFQANKVPIPSFYRIGSGNLGIGAPIISFKKTPIGSGIKFRPFL